MIHEIAEIDILPGLETQFESAVENASKHFKAADGYISMSLHRSIENPSRYRLVVGWETVEHHTINFRESEGFQAWRALAGPCFAAPPRVEHVATVFKAD